MQPEPTASAVPDVTISIVSLNTRDLLSDCLRSVSSSVGITREVRVVDNGSSDGSPEMVARDYPKVELICSRINRGFAAANNIAIHDANSRYLLLLNPDTLIRPDTLSQMITFMDGRPDVGICGPRILFPDGRFQSCGYRFPTLLSEIQQSRNLGAIARRLVGNPTPLSVEAEPFEVDWVDGACLLIRREVVQQIGLLDEQYFLYAEELDWCHRARRAGWPIYALPSVEMAHYQGQSSAQMSDFSLGLLIETRLRYYRKNRGLGMALAMSLVYIAGCLKQWHGSRRQQQAVKLKATLRWWRSLLAA
jgi:GT2 family glycosyltransferase